MGWHGSNSGTITLKNVRVPKGNLLGKDGDGLKYLAYNSPDEFMLTGALCLGMAEAAYDMAVKYSMERMQLGKSMFDNFQVTRFKLANMKLEIEALRDFIYTTYDLRDKGMVLQDRSRMLKIKASKVAEYVCSEAIQLHGGVGVVEGTELYRFWIDSKISQIAGGSLEALYDSIAQSVKAEYHKRG
jgi:alkylation response protein AidB-like acyl-CoA dehydrogenase